MCFDIRQNMRPSCVVIPEEEGGGHYCAIDCKNSTICFTMAGRFKDNPHARGTRASVAFRNAYLSPLPERETLDIFRNCVYSHVPMSLSSESSRKLDNLRPYSCDWKSTPDGEKIINCQSQTLGLISSSTSLLHFDISTTQAENTLEKIRSCVSEDTTAAVRDKLRSFQVSISSRDEAAFFGKADTRKALTDCPPTHDSETL
jgi:hypothetical protein